MVDFTDTPEQAEFRTTVRAFIEESAAEAEKPGEDPMMQPAGSAKGFRDSESATRRWRTELVKRGWLAPHWPEEYGGAGLSVTDNEILDMMVYPNPVDGNYVTILSPVQGSKEIQVFTVTGRKVMDTAINGNTSDVSSFNSGFYMLKVTINGQSKISKLVVR